MSNKVFEIVNLGGPSGVIAKVQELIEAGFTIDSNESRRIGNNVYLIFASAPESGTLEQEGADEAPESSGPTVIGLEDLKKKDELLEYANVNGIEVPEDMKQPAAIKKYLKGFESKAE